MIKITGKPLIFGHFFKNVFVFEELVLRAQKELEAVATLVETARVSFVRKTKNPSSILQHKKSRQGYLKSRYRSVSIARKGLKNNVAAVKTGQLRAQNSERISDQDDVIAQGMRYYIPPTGVGTTGINDLTRQSS